MLEVRVNRECQTLPLIITYLKVMYEKKDATESCDEILVRAASDRKKRLSKSWSLTTQRKCLEEINGCKKIQKQRPMLSQLNRNIRNRMLWPLKPKMQ